MLSVLFWNLMGNEVATWATRAANLRSSLTRMAGGLDVDLFLFAESAFDPGEVIASLNAPGAGTYTLPPNPNPNQRIQILSRLPPGSMGSQFDSGDGRLTSAG